METNLITKKLNNKRLVQELFNNYKNDTTPDAKTGKYIIYKGSLEDIVFISSKSGLEDNFIVIEK